jgi:ABC-2 type transport system permease protein
MNGAGVSHVNGAGVSLFGAQARAQYAALAALRWHIFTNGLRSGQGALELGARTIGFALFAVLGLGLGVGMGAGAYAIASNQAWVFLPLLFWGLFVPWQVLPVMLASFQEQFDLGSLLRFPVSFGSFFLLYVVFGLSDVSSIVGGCCCLGIWAGITIAQPGLFAWTALGLAVFAVFNIFLVRSIFAWIDRWLAQRKTREILGAVFLVSVLSLQLLNPALHQHRRPGPAGHADQAAEFSRQRAEFEPWLRTANAVQAWLPPGLAALALRKVAAHQAASALASLGVLGLYVLAAGGVLAVRLRAEYRGESLGVAPGRQKESQGRNKTTPAKSSAVAGEVRSGQRHGGWPLDGPIAAVMEKELRSLLRTLPFLYAIGAPLVLVFVFSAMFHNTNPGHGHTFALALPLAMAYALLGFTQLIYNNLGAEGAGIQLLFLSPTPIRTVILAKNLFHALLFGLNALLAGILVSLRIGPPGATVVAATFAWLLFALMCNLAVGDVFSLTMAYRVNPGRMTRQRGSQANALLSLVVQLAVLGAGAAVFAVCTFFDRLWIAVPVFLVLAGGGAFAWMRVLSNAEGLANRRRDSLIATLAKAQ